MPCASAADEAPPAAAEPSPQCLCGTVYVVRQHLVLDNHSRRRCILPDRKVKVCLGDIEGRAMRCVTREGATSLSRRAAEEKQKEFTQVSPRIMVGRVPGGRAKYYRRWTGRRRFWRRRVYRLHHELAVSTALSASMPMSARPAARQPRSVDPAGGRQKSRARRILGSNNDYSVRKSVTCARWFLLR